MPPAKKKTSPSSPPPEQHLRLRIICKAPPRPEEHGAQFGLQDNSETARWILHPGTVQPNGDHHFAFEVRVRPHARTGAPNFLGEFVHGDPTQRFVYLSWRPLTCRPIATTAAASPFGQRRMKIHLGTITWAQIEDAARKGAALEAVVEGKARDGGPNCASVPLLGDGWSLRTPPA